MLNYREKNILEELSRIKSLINHANSKSLIEQKENDIKSLSDLTLKKISPQKEKKEEKIDPEVQNYKNSCRYSDKAIVPERDTHGLKGMEAIKATNWQTSKDGKTQYLWCAYPYKDNIIWTPNNSIVTFWDVPSISNFADKFVKTMETWGSGKNGSDVWNVWSKDNVIQQLSKLCRPNTVSIVQIGNGENDVYKTAISWLVENNDPYSKKSMQHIIEITGLKNEQNQPLPQPNWVDPRNPVEKFIDEWGEAVELAAAVATFVAGFFTGGATWVIWAEIVLEGIIGVTVGIRQLMTGDNIGGCLSFIFAIMPFIKLPMRFKGIDSSYFPTLSKKLAESGLTKDSTVDDYIRFFNGLNDGEKKIMTVAFRYGDDVAYGETLKYVKKELGDLSKNTKELMKIAEELTQQNKELYTPIKWFKRMETVELTAQLSSFAVGLGLQAFLGSTLNDEQKMLLSGVHAKTPDELKKYWLINLTENIKDPKFAENLTNVLKEQEKNMKSIYDLKLVKENYNKYKKMIIDQSITDNGGKIYGTETTTIQDLEKITLNNIEDLKKYKKEGWITIYEREGRPISEVIQVTNEFYDENNNKIRALYKIKYDVKIEKKSILDNKNI